MNAEEKEKLQEKLEQDVWRLISKHGHYGDTYHWTIEMLPEGEEDTVCFEGGCNY